MNIIFNYQTELEDVLVRIVQKQFPAMGESLIKPAIRHVAELFKEKNQIEYWDELKREDLISPFDEFPTDKKISIGYAQFLTMITIFLDCEIDEAKQLASILLEGKREVKSTSLFLLEKVKVLAVEGGLRYYKTWLILKCPRFEDAVIAKLNGKL